MVLRNFEEGNGWMTSGWSATWPMGWDMILNCAAACAEDMEHPQLLTVAGPGSEAEDKTGVAFGEGNGLNREVLAEAGLLTIRGMSRLLGVPVSLTFYNQSPYVTLVFPVSFMDSFDTEDNPYRRISLEMGQFLDSIEILGRVRK